MRLGAYSGASVPDKLDLTIKQHPEVHNGNPDLLRLRRDSHPGGEAAVKINLVTLAWLWLWCGGALVLSVLKFLRKQWFPGLLLAVIGVAAILMAASYLWSLNRLEIPHQSLSACFRVLLLTRGQLHSAYGGRLSHRAPAWP